VDSTQALMIAGVILNLVISSGALWKLFDFAKGYGAQEQTVKTHEKRIDRIEGVVFPNAPFIRR
jgi:hypothetical protein